MGKAIRVLVLTLLTVWVVTAVAYRLWQKHTGRITAADRAAAKAAPPHFAKPGPELPPGISYAPHTLAEIACGRTVTTKDQAITCPVCPKGSDDGDDPQPVEGGAWTYDSALPGHFTSPTATEALVHINGCESHASNMGGDFLLRNVGGAWSVVRYVHAGLANADCKTLPWPGGGSAAGSAVGDAVICDNGDMHQGIVSDALTFTRYGADAPEKEPTGDHSIFLMVTDESATCDPGDATGPDPVQVASIRRWSLVPGSGGRQDLQLETEVEQRHRQKGGDGCRPGTVQHVAMRFRNLGDHFEAVPEGFATMKALQGRSDTTLTREVRPEAY